MDGRLLIAICFGMATLIVGVYVFMVKHLSNSRRHANADHLVFKETCKSDMKGLRDCVEVELEYLKKGQQGLRDDMNTGFGDLKDLIKNQKTA